MLVSSRHRSHRLPGSPGKSGTIEATADGSARAPSVWGASAPSSRTRNIRPAYSSILCSRSLSPAINNPTTAVQTIDQLEDLLRRLGASELDAGRAADGDGALRLIFPTPTWEDYLTLAFDEIRHLGSSPVQVMRRMRSALVGLADSLLSQKRAEAARRYLEHLDRVVEASSFDVEDRRMARQEDRQGIGLSRQQSDAT